MTDDRKPETKAQAREADRMWRARVERDDLRVELEVVHAQRDALLERELEIITKLRTPNYRTSWALIGELTGRTAQGVQQLHSRRSGGSTGQ